MTERSEAVCSVDYSAISPEELVHNCLSGRDEAAWVEFIRRFQPLIASVVFRVSRQWGESSPGMIDDLVQETYLKLCTEGLRILDKFEAIDQVSIYRYVKVFAANLAHDHFKASHAQKRGGSAETAPLNTDTTTERATWKDSETKNLERKILIGEIAACLAAEVSGPKAERDCRIFWLYYRVGLSASAIATLPSIGLSTKGVESTILRLTRAVRRQLAPKKAESQSPLKSVEGIRSAESL
jgi:RNA polymerase sigma-70 factor (ECF subfamily)